MAVNKTPNLNLPQYSGTDLFNLEEINESYRTIDAVYGEVKTMHDIVTEKHNAISELYNKYTPQELERQAIEQQRQTQELERISDEETRVLAEATRVSEFNTMKVENGTFKEETTTGYNNFKEEVTVNYNNFKEEITTGYNNFKESVNEQILNSKTDYFGKEHSSVNERLNEDFDKLWQFNNESQLLEYSGSNITANNTYYGLTKDLSIKGRTLQNLIGKPIKTVGSKPENATINGNIVKCVAEDGYYVGVQYQNNNLIKPNTKYTLIINVIECTFTKGYIQLLETNANTPWDSFTSSVIENKVGIHKLSFMTRDAFGKYLLNSMIPNKGMNTGEYIKFEIIALLEGDHTNTPLSELPYIEGIQSVGETDIVDGKYPIKVKSCGKNLINPKNLADTFISNGVTFTKLENYSISCKGTATATADYPIYESGKCYLNKGTYTVKIHTSDINTRLLIGGNGSVVPYTEVEGNKSVTFTLSSYTDIGHFRIRVLKDVTVDTEVSIQLEESSTPTDYEPYKESTTEYLLDEPLRSLPNGVCDEILGNKLIRRVGKVVLDGSENWAQVGFNDIVTRFSCYIDKAKNGICLSDRFAQRKVVTISDTNEGISLSTFNNGLYIAIYNTKISENTPTAFKQWLQANPVTVYYELATPIITELDKSLVLNSFDTTTHITSDNYLLPTITTKVPSNVQAVVTNLMEENKELKNINEEQEKTMDVSLCATDELYTMLEPLLIETYSLNGCNDNMVNLYRTMVNRGLKSIEDIPEKYKDKI